MSILKYAAVGEHCVRLKLSNETMRFDLLRTVSIDERTKLAKKRG
jgi:hypothetical protein